MREQSIVNAFDAARIAAEAQTGKAKTLGGYLDELLSDEERAAKSEEQFFAWLDRSIGTDTLQ